jgi:hypothetical protein
MVSQRELRYYASIPKILIVLIGSAGFTFAGWQILKSDAHAFMTWFALGFFGLCTLVAVAWLIMTIALRKPLLQFTEAGVTSSQALRPWRTYFVPWSNVAGIGIRVRRSPSGYARNTSYYLVIQARRPDSATKSRVGRMSMRMYPSLAGAAEVVRLNSLFFLATRARRLRVLEHIKTTFAPEIIQHNIWVDQEERPL